MPLWFYASIFYAPWEYASMILCLHGFYASIHLGLQSFMPPWIYAPCSWQCILCLQVNKGKTWLVAADRFSGVLNLCPVWICPDDFMPPYFMPRVDMPPWFYASMTFMPPYFMPPLLYASVYFMPPCILCLHGIYASMYFMPPSMFGYLHQQ